MTSGKPCQTQGGREAGPFYLIPHCSFWVGGSIWWKGSPRTTGVRIGQGCQKGLFFWITAQPTMRPSQGQSLPQAWYKVVHHLASLQSTLTNCKSNYNISKYKNRVLPCVLITFIKMDQKIAQIKPQGYLSHWPASNCVCT